MSNRHVPCGDCCGECVTRTYNPTWPGFSLTDATIDGSNRIEIDAGGLATVSVPSSSDYSLDFKITRKTTAQDFEFNVEISPTHTIHVRGTSTTLRVYVESCCCAEIGSGFTCQQGAPGETIEGVRVKVDREWVSPAQVKMRLEIHPLRANGTLHPDAFVGFDVIPANRIRNSTFTSCGEKNATSIRVDNIGSAILLLREMSFAGGPENLDCLSVTGGSACCHGSRPHQFVLTIDAMAAVSAPSGPFYWGWTHNFSDASLVKICGTSLPTLLAKYFYYEIYPQAIGAFSAFAATYAATTRSGNCAYKCADASIALPSVQFNVTTKQDGRSDTSTTFTRTRAVNLSHVNNGTTALSYSGGGKVWLEDFGVAHSIPTLFRRFCGDCISYDQTDGPDDERGTCEGDFFYTAGPLGVLGDVGGNTGPYIFDVSAPVVTCELQYL